MPQWRLAYSVVPSAHVLTSKTQLLQTRQQLLGADTQVLASIQIKRLALVQVWLLLSPSNVCSHLVISIADDAVGEEPELMKRFGCCCADEPDAGLLLREHTGVQSAGQRLPGDSRLSQCHAST